MLLCRSLLRAYRGNALFCAAQLPSATYLQSFILHNTEVVTEHLTPEIKLLLLTPRCKYWHLPPEHWPYGDPYWAIYWPGGQALARFFLDNPDVIRGRGVLDLGSGCGAVSIAAKMGGASYVVANDIDPVAGAAFALNCQLNGSDNLPFITENVIGEDVRRWDVIGEDARRLDVIGEDVRRWDVIGEDARRLDVIGEDARRWDVIGEDARRLDVIGEDARRLDVIGEDARRLDIIGEDARRWDVIGEDARRLDVIGEDARRWDVIALGDMFYDEQLADSLRLWLRRCVEQHGTTVLIGDPGRGHFLGHPIQKELRKVAEYSLPESSKEENYGLSTSAVWRYEPGPSSPQRDHH
ncbi:electron transfer flavoprotein beta subunit lysine methyltransferase [Ranitomeya variabilis]|uniref:electron transfer flavoprotein beta subunit lysine methyltransferase n=1 Tax=Ranitomeya variabilis TaxID=490064 RepID=UPI0040574F25